MKEKFRAIKLLYSSAMGRNGIIYPHSSRKRASRLIPSTATNTALISCHTLDRQDARFEIKRVRQMYTIFCVMLLLFFVTVRK